MNIYGALCKHIFTYALSIYRVKAAWFQANGVMLFLAKHIYLIAPSHPSTTYSLRPSPTLYAIQILLTYLRTYLLSSPEPELMDL